MSNYQPRTRGDMCNLTVNSETVYGTPSGSNSYAGTLLTIKDSDAVTRQNYWKCGQRTPAGSKLVGCSYGYSATFNAVGGKGVTEKWLDMAGILDGVKTRMVSSHTAVIKVAPEEIHSFLGSSVDTFEMSASEIGGFVEYSVDCKSRFHSLATSTAGFKQPDGTAIADTGLTSTPDGAPVVYTNMWIYTDKDGVNRPVPATSWTFTLSNNLQSHAGLSSDNGDGLRLEDGYQPTVGEHGATLSLTFPSESDTYDKMRLAQEVISLVELDIDGVTISLHDCTINPAGPSRTSEGRYEETLELTARIATAVRFAPVQG